MDDLYTELMIETEQWLVNNIMKNWIVSNLRSWDGEKGQQKKAWQEDAVQDGAGMGKTTLVKEVASDWAKGIFSVVPVVHFAFLKLVNLLRMWLQIKHLF